MALATWWDGDSLSNLSPLAGFSAGLERANEGPMLGCLCLAADRSGK